MSEPDETSAAPNTKQEKEDAKKKSYPPKPPKLSSKTKFRPYRGKLKSAGISKMMESLEESEMKMIYDEIVASMPPSEDKPSTLLNMPASCTSILKVRKLLIIFRIKYCFWKEKKCNFLQWSRKLYDAHIHIDITLIAIYKFFISCMAEYSFVIELWICLFCTVNVGIFLYIYVH